MAMQGEKTGEDVKKEVLKLIVAHIASNQGNAGVTKVLKELRKQIEKLPAN